MSSTTLATPNRRRRVRHRIQTPAYASFTSESKTSLLDLHEIVDISEDGIAIQCHSPLEIKKNVDLCLDLADCPDHIHTTGQVIWANESGRAGLRFSELSADALARLREWLFVNVMAGVANGETEISDSTSDGPPRPSYTDTLAAVSAVQRQVESLGSDFVAALQLIAAQSKLLLHASGCAIALADKDPEFMICRASAGSDAPPVGAKLQVGSGFSGECVKTGMVLRCDDAEIDARVDRDTCRALGIRSILAVPVRKEGKSLGLIEAFAASPNVFSEIDGRVLQRFAETIVAAMNRAGDDEDEPGFAQTSARAFSLPGGVLFSQHDRNDKTESDGEKFAGISLPRSHILILACAAATIFLVLGFLSAPTLQGDVLPWVRAKFHSRDHEQIATVLASTRAPIAATPNAAIETASFDQLLQMADKGNPEAQNAVGLRYATGDGVKLNEGDAVRWFIRAAEQGNVPAQSKLGSIYFSGRGVPQDSTRAYFWMVVARLSGDEASQTLAPFVRARLTRGQVTAIELQADRWLQQHQAQKPQLKATR